MNGNLFGKLAMVGIIAVLFIALVGCSNSNPLTTSQNTNSVETPSLSLSNQTATFTVKGVIEKFDVDQRWIKFKGGDFSTRPTLVSVARDANMKLTPDGETIPFNFKYIQIGQELSVTGQNIGATRSGDLFVLFNGTGPIDITEAPSLSISGGNDVSHAFRVHGIVEKFDADQRFIKFEGTDFGTHPTTFYIDRDATMMLMPSQTEIPFNFKFIDVGTALDVMGNVRADGKRIATDAIVYLGGGPIATNNNMF